MRGLRLGIVGSEAAKFVWWGIADPVRVPSVSYASYGGQ